MAKYTINESQLRSVIEEQVKAYLMEAYDNAEVGEEINEDLEDEGLRDIWNGVKGAFKNDAENVKSGVNNAVQSVKNGYNNAVQGVKNGYNAVANAATDAVNNVKKGVGQRVDAFKANYQASQYEGKINDVINTLTELQNDGVIGGQQTNAMVAQLIKQLQMVINGHKGRAAKVANKVGK